MEQPNNHLQQRLPVALLDSISDRLRRVLISQNTLSRAEIFSCLATSQRELIEVLEFYTNEARTDIRRFG